MLPFFRLVRLPNLVIVALTQYLLFYHILLPAFKKGGVSPEMHPVSFWMLCLATLMVTAAGYVINERYDQAADAINKPGRRVVGVYFSERWAMRAYYALGIAGLALSAFLAFSLHKLPWLTLYPVSFGLLYYYTAFAQRRVLLGNLLIAAFCAGVAGLLWLAEIRTLSELSVKAPGQYLRVRVIFLWYGIFALLINFFREIVKDLEDLPGDRAAGNRTLPVLAGTAIAIKVAQTVAVGLLLFLVLPFRYLLSLFGFPLPVFLGVIVVPPLVWTLFILEKASCPKDFRRISHWIKLILLVGVLSLLFVPTR